MTGAEIVAREPLLVVLASTLILAGGVALVAIPLGASGVAVAVSTALVVRVAYGLGTYWTGPLAPDAAVYDDRAQAILAAWAGLGPPVDLVAGKEGFPYVLAGIYWLVGYAPEVGILLNSVIGAGTVVVTVYTCRVLQWQQAVHPAAWLIALWPASIYWGPLLLREAIVSMLLALALLGAVLLRSGRYVPGSALVAVSGIAMIWMRGGLALLVIVGMPALVGVSHVIPRPSMAGVRRSLPFLATSLALTAFLLSDRLPLLSGRVEDAEYFDESRMERATEALDVGATAFSTAGVTADNLVWQFVNVAIGPLPMAWRNLPLLAAGIDAVLWIALWGLALYGYRNLTVNRWGAVLCTAPALALLAYLAMTLTNFGIIMRLRALGLPLLVPLAAVGIAVLIERRGRPRTLAAQVS